MRGPSPMKVPGAGGSAGAGGSLFGRSSPVNSPKPGGSGLPPVGFGGKGSRLQKLPGLGSKSTITGGSPMAQAMGNYGKDTSSLGPGLSDPSTNVDPKQHPGMSPVRDSGGGIKTHPRQGGLGPDDNSGQGTDI